VTSADGKAYNSTGDHTCTVAAQCGSGFYGGGTYDAYNSGAAVQTFLEKGGSLLDNSFLEGGISTYWTEGKHRLRDLRVHDTASNTKRFALYFKAGPLKSVKTSTFRVLPRTIRVTNNKKRDVGTLGDTDYITGSSLGAYTIELTGNDWWVNDKWISGVDQDDGFNVTAFMVTGAGGDSTKLPNYPESYTILDPEDLKTFDTGQGDSEVAKPDHTLLLSSSTKRFQVRFETANQAGRGYQIVLKLNIPSNLGDLDRWPDGSGADLTNDMIVLQSWKDNIYYPFRLDPVKMVASYGAYA